MKSPFPLAALVVLYAAVLEGQTEPTGQTKKPSPFKDPEDGALDVGGWISTRTGILPLPILITEPAIG